jgi:hypothetical protein
VEAHNGEAVSQRLAFDALPAEMQNDLIEFLKSLQVLPPGSKSLVVEKRDARSRNVQCEMEKHGDHGNG